MPFLLLLRYWREASMGLLALACVLFHSEARHFHKVADHETALRKDAEANLKRQQADYRAAAEVARKADAANKARVEAAQSQSSKEVSDELKAKLADARRRYDALRLRLGKTATDPGASRGPSVPGASSSAERVADAPGQDRLPPADALICTENSLRLEGWQDWWKRVSVIPR